jgi:hypothetical protein
VRRPWMEYVAYALLGSAILLLGLLIAGALLS